MPTRPRIFSVFPLLALVLTVFLAGALTACSDGDGGGGRAEVVGTIQGSIGDQQGPWNALRIERGEESISTATWYNVMGDLYSYTIQGHEGRVFAVANSISIGVTRTGDRYLDPDVTWFPESSLAPNYSPVDGSVAVNIEKAEQTPEGIRIEGTATGTVYRVPSMMAEPDMDDSLAVDLRFEALLTEE